MNQNSYRNLVAGTEKGLFKSLLRAVLGVISLVYKCVVSLRNIGYDIGISKGTKVDAAVISIGNITTGGTGKTPLVIWLCDVLKSRSVSCAILTRGYKSQKGKLTDEPAMLAKSCGDAWVIVNSDRSAGAKKAINEFGAKVLVMDDGFQHRKLRRDLDIVAVDATRPFGYGKILPAGLLREPVKSLRRAQAVIITRFDQGSRENMDDLVERIEKIAPGITIAKAVHKHSYAKMMKGEKLSIEELREKKIYAFCGIGNPDAFLNNLENSGFSVVGSKVYNDHHDYTAEDMSEIHQEAKELGADLVLSTEKDWVKTALLVMGNFDIVFAYLVLELDFIDGADKIEALVDSVIESSR